MGTMGATNLKKEHLTHYVQLLHSNTVKLFLGANPKFYQNFKREIQESQLYA